jgi:hypothetical protein
MPRTLPPAVAVPHCKQQLWEVPQGAPLARVDDDESRASADLSLHVEQERCPRCYLTLMNRNFFPSWKSKQLLLVTQHSALPGS